MKRVFTRSLCLALFVTAAICAATCWQTEARASGRGPGGPVSISYFYDSLSPYGEWFQDGSYGWCWTPYDVSAEWRPYSDGHWEYSDYGWSWASNEQWGWAPYHYGRWLFDDSYGWVWVPGTEWAPAWVAWRYGNDWVGWAPLPPTASWDPSGGLAFADANTIPSYGWCFVPQRHVLDVKLRMQVTMVARNVTLIGRSRDVTRFEVRGGRPANVGLDVAQVESNVGRRVSRVKIIDADGPGKGRGQSVGHGGVGFFRPAIQPVSPGQMPAPSMAQGRDAIPDNVLQSQRAKQQRKLESDLKTERARLARDQKNELRGQKQGPAVDELRKQQAAEQQAFDAHATLQRQVLDQRIQKHVVNPGRAKKARKPSGNGNGKSKG